MMIVIGLGNPGRRYKNTRHNLGHDVVRCLAERLRVELQEDGWTAWGKTRVASASLILAIPETYMNVSGQAVKDLLRRRHRGPGDLLVVHDDLDLALGHIRIRPGDGAGGHNGVRSIMEELGTGAFARLRIGTGRPPAGVDPAEFVLDRFTAEERLTIDRAVTQAAEAAFVAATDGLAAAMNRYNRRPTSESLVQAPGEGDRPVSYPAR
ncbi:MAG TPA: aminoacyl-tRNA hydrolase [bacterium]|nr:aminoacyl-tRNA hydrolase [bacterium]